MGPTASGKTALAEALADDLQAQLISADAFQAYRGMDVGTAKPIDKARYSLLDLKDPDEGYGVGEFCTLAQRLLTEIWQQQRAAIVVGGTGLYIRALFEEYQNLDRPPPEGLRDELNAQFKAEGLAPLVARLKVLDADNLLKIDYLNPVRVTRGIERLSATAAATPVSLPPFRKIKLGLNAPKEKLDGRIEERTYSMVQNGWIQEVQALLGCGFETDCPGFRAIGYSEIAAYLKNETGLEEAVQEAVAQTRRYAKRQRTWLRSEPRLVEIETAGDPREIGLGAALREIHSVMQ